MTSVPADGNFSVDPDDPAHWKPGTFGFHELPDRERLVTNLWNDKVANHILFELWIAAR